MMKKHLRIIVPLRFQPWILDYCTERFAGHLPHATLSVGFLLDSVHSTVSDYDQAFNAPWILKSVQSAIRDGCDGVFIDVAFDTGLSAAKSLASIPIVGALESAIAYARTLCRRFAILAINNEEVPVNHRLSREYGFADLLSSIETIDIPVMDLQRDHSYTLMQLIDAGKRALSTGAQAIVLGCTAMSWAAQPLAEHLHVPVLDTNFIGLYMLDTLVQLGLTPSRREYMTPSGWMDLTDEEYSALRRITFTLPARDSLNLNTTADSNARRSPHDTPRHSCMNHDFISR